MIITFKAIVIPNNRRKDGTYPVKIRVTFKGISRRLPTTLACSASDLTRSLKIKNATILTKADQLIARMREATSDISPFDLENWDVDRVVRHIKGKLTTESFRLDFFAWAEQYLVCKSDTTRRAYAQALNTLERFLGKRQLDINDITRAMLLDFVDFVEKSPKMHFDPKTRTWKECRSVKVPKGMASLHLMKLQHIFNAAKDRYNDDDTGRILIPRSPFDKIAKTFTASKGQKSLGRELMQKIISAQVDIPAQRRALDIFIISFGLMGANMADLYNATPFQGEWVYNRQKTSSRRADGALMRVEVPAELTPYIARLQEEGDTWWLPVLHRIGKSKDICTAMVNRALKKWCEDNDVPVFTFYAARHTWASVARKAGVEKATIDDCLCHKGDYALTDIYAEKSWELIRNANRTVIDLFNW